MLRFRASPLRRFVFLVSLVLSSPAGLASTPKEEPAKPPPKEPARPAVPKIPAFEVVTLGPHAWAGRFGLSNCAWLELGDGVLLVDTGADMQAARQLSSEIKRTTEGKPVKWIVVTHLHDHANTGLPSFVSSAVTIFVNASTGLSAAALRALSQDGKPPTVEAVKESAAVKAGGRSIEIFAPKGAAATAADLWVHVPDLHAVFASDLVRPGLCPLMNDPDCDPIGWREELQRISALTPDILVGSSGDRSRMPSADLAATRAYLERIFNIAKETKDKNLPEARLSSTLTIVAKIGDFCPASTDTNNGLAIFRRLEPDGTLRSGSRPGPPARPAQPN